MLDVRHAIDVMHLTKNVCMNILSFLNLYGKCNDTLQTRKDLQHWAEKACAPLCTVSCVHQISYFDSWRNPQTLKSPVTEEHHSKPLVKISGIGE